MAEILVSLPEFIQTAYDIAQSIRTIVNARRDSQRIANHVEAMALVVDKVLTRLEQSIPQSGPSNPLLIEMNNLSPLFTQLRKVFEEIRAKLQQKKGWREALRSIKWLENKDEVKGLLDDIEKLKSSLLLALTYDTSVHAQDGRALRSEVADAFSTLHSDFDDEFARVNEQLENLQIAANDQKKTEVIQTLLQRAARVPKNEPPPSLPSPKRYGQWLFSSEEFQYWRDNRSRTLWCQGLAGAGKTTLSAITVAHLIDQLSISSDQDKIPVVSLYCRFNEKLNEAGLLASLWSQLASFRRLSSEDVERLDRRYIKQQRSTDLDEWIDLARKECTYTDRLFIVVDALDEFTSGFPWQLVTILQSLSPEANIMFTSRNTLSDHERNHLRNVHEVTIEAHQDDLGLFVDEVLADDTYVARQTRQDRQLFDRVRNKILTSAKGIFQVGRILMEDLRSADTMREINSTLDNPYGSIQEAYDTTFQRLADTKKRKGIAAISIVCVAKSPLTLEQLCQIISISRNEFSLPKDAIIDGDYLIDLCGGHARVEKRSQVVYLHETVMEYVRQHRPDDVDRAQATIISSCLTYLQFPEVGIGNWKGHPEIREMIKQHSLLAYSATYWGDHLREYPAGKDEEFDTDVNSLLAKDTNMACAARVLLHRTAQEFIQAHQWGGWGKEKSTQGLVKRRNLLAYFGLTRLLDQRLQKFPDITNVTKIDPFGSVLHWAVLGNHEATIQRILRQPGAEHLMDLTEIDLFVSPLHIGLRLNKNNAVRLLLEAGADPRVQSSKTSLRGHSLKMAIEAGNSETIELLLTSKYGKELLAQGDVVGDLALHTAAKKRPWKYDAVRVIRRLLPGYSQALAEGLLSPGDLYNSRGLNPLQEASRRGFSTIINTLLEHRLGQTLALGQSSLGKTALDIALYIGRQSVVETLFARIDDKRWLQEQTQSIVIAAEMGNNSIIEFLLNDKTFEANFSRDTMCSAFQAAAQGGFVECLASITNSLTPSAGELSDALLVAAQQGHQEIVEALISCGADINSLDSNGRTPLHLACQNECAGVIRALLQNGCRLDLKDKDGNTALADALEHRLPNSAGLLLGATATFVATGAGTPRETELKRFAEQVKLKPTYFPSTTGHILEAAFILKIAIGDRTSNSMAMINYILELAEYWIRSHTMRQEEKHCQEIHEGPIYLRSMPIRGRKQSPVCKIEFLVQSHDQSHQEGIGTYDQSYTWFEASTWAKSGRKFCDYVDRQERVKLFTNKTKTRDWTTHHISWPLNRRNENNVGLRASNTEVNTFLDSLERGDRVILVPDAIFIGWVNYVRKAEMTVYTSFLRKTVYQHTSNGCLQWA